MRLRRDRIDLSDFEKKPEVFDASEKTRAEIIESYLKIRELLTPEFRRFATWSTLISTTVSVIAIVFSIVANNWQRAQNDLQIATKANQLSVKELELASEKATQLELNKDLVRRQAELDAAENGFKIKEAQVESQLRAFNETQAQLTSVKKQLEDLQSRLGRQTDAYVGVTKVTDAAKAAVQDANQIGQALTMSQATSAVSAGVSGAPEERAQKLRQLAARLFAPSYQDRNKAFDTLVGNFLGDPNTCSTIIAHASEHLDQPIGISNSLEIIRLSNWAVVRRNLVPLNKLLVSIGAAPKLMASTLIRRRVTLIQDRLKRHAST